MATTFARSVGHGVTIIVGRAYLRLERGFNQRVVKPAVPETGGMSATVCRRQAERLFALPAAAGV
jgi:hypothetical protein